MKDFFQKSYKLLILNVACFVIIWPLLDLAWSKLIRHEVFQYSVSSHIVMPIIMAVIVTVVEHLNAKKKSK